MPAQLRDLCVETIPAEPSGNPRSERSLNGSFAPDGVPKDLPNLLFRAAPMPLRAPLELGFYVVIQLTDQQLSHGCYAITIANAVVVGRWGVVIGRAGGI